VSATIERPIVTGQILFDERQAAAMLGMSERQLRALGGQIRSFKVKRSRRYHRADLEAFAEQMRAAS
jgi:hypothetical protein